MKKFIFLVFLPFFSLTGWAQPASLDRAQAIAQDLSSIEDSNPNSWEKQNSDKPYTGLLSETDTVIHDDWSFDQDYHARVRIQKETAKNLGQWPIYYNISRENITDIKAFVETSDGRKFEATDIRDVPAYDQSPLYSDMHIKVITLPDVSLGTVIDVRVKTKVFKEEIPNQFWDEVVYPSIPTKYVRYTYIFPDNKPIHFFAYNNDKKPLIHKMNGTVNYSFIFEDTTYSDNEDFMPPTDEMIGVLSLSSMNDWGQVADWWRRMINSNTIDDPNISSKSLDLVKAQIGPKDKVRAILEFIQDNFRYVPMTIGDHAVDLRATDQIFKNRYGDAKDLAVLTKQMLTKVGVNSNICLFSNEFNGDPLHRLPNPSAFDHVLLEVNFDNQKYFVDPLAKGFDVGQLPASYDNAQVLIIGADSFHFENIPVAEESFHSIFSTSDITLGDDGSAAFQVNVKLPVEASEDFKKIWDPTSDGSKQKFFDKLQATFGQGGKITDHEVKGLESRYGSLEFSFKYAASNIYQMANDMILLREEQADNLPDFVEDKRRYSIFVPTNSLVINRNTYHIPESLKINFVPQDYNLKTDFMQVSVKYSRGFGAITVESLYRLKRATISKHGYGDVKKFRDEVEKRNQLYIVLKKKTSLAPEAESWIKNQ